MQHHLPRLPAKRRDGVKDKTGVITAQRDNQSCNIEIVSVFRQPSLVWSVYDTEMSSTLSLGSYKQQAYSSFFSGPTVFIFESEHSLNSLCRRHDTMIESNNYP